MADTTTPVEELSVLDTLRAQRKDALDEIGNAIAKREQERSEFEARSDVPDDDQTAYATAEEDFRVEHGKRKQRLETIVQRIDEEELKELRLKIAADASRPEARLSVTKEPLTYERGNGRSYFRDLAVTQVKGVDAISGDPAEAQTRLQAHGNEVRVEWPKIQRQMQRDAYSRIEDAESQFTGSFRSGVRQRGLEHNPFDSFEQRVTPNRLDGEGGYFVPPLWLPEFIAALRAGRVVADQVRKMPLPDGTDSINMPKISTTTLVGVQQADATPVASQDFTDTSVQANVKTLAGQSDVSLQLLEQSPYHLDEVIMQDLMADYNRLIDRQVIYSPGTSTTALNAGQVVGLYPSTNWTSTLTRTWTNNPTLPGAFFAVMGAQASQIAQNRFSVQNLHYFVNPRRWYWFATASDGVSGTAGRPLAGNDRFGPFNVAALEDAGDEPAEGLVAQVPFGPHNIYIDANVPTTDNGSGVLTGTYDVSIALKTDDAWLFEGALRTRALSEVLSGTLEVRFQVFNYIAFLLRYGQSLCIASGAGFAAPASAFGAEILY